MKEVRVIFPHDLPPWWAWLVETLRVLGAKRRLANRVFPLLGGKPESFTEAQFGTELRRTLCHPECGEMLWILVANGVLQHFLPELIELDNFPVPGEKFSQLDLAIGTVEKLPPKADLVTRYVALLRNIALTEGPANHPRRGAKMAYAILTERLHEPAWVANDVAVIIAAHASLREAVKDRPHDGVSAFVLSRLNFGRLEEFFRGTLDARTTNHRPNSIQLLRNFTGIRERRRSAMNPRAIKKAKKADGPNAITAFNLRHWCEQHRLRLTDDVQNEALRAGEIAFLEGDHSSIHEAKSWFLVNYEHRLERE